MATKATTSWTGKGYGDQFLLTYFVYLVAFVAFVFDGGLSLYKKIRE